MLEAKFGTEGEAPKTDAGVKITDAKVFNLLDEVTAVRFALSLLETAVNVS